MMTTTRSNIQPRRSGHSAPSLASPILEVYRSNPLGFQYIGLCGDVNNADAHEGRAAKVQGHIVLIPRHALLAKHNNLLTILSQKKACGKHNSAVLLLIAFSTCSWLRGSAWQSTVFRNGKSSTSFEKNYTN